MGGPGRAQDLNYLNNNLNFKYSRPELNKYFKYWRRGGLGRARVGGPGRAQDLNYLNYLIPGPGGGVPAPGPSPDPPPTRALPGPPRCQ